jgi:hypothetical protein
MGRAGSRKNCRTKSVHIHSGIDHAPPASQTTAKAAAMETARKGHPSLAMMG